MKRNINLFKCGGDKMYVVAVYDMFFLLCASLMVYILAKNDGEISKKEGLAMVIAYVAYTVFIILR